MEIIRLVYVAGFGFTAIVCFISISRVPQVTDTDTQRGLIALLVLNGVWALTHIGRLSPLSANGQIAFYLIGLIVGLATVGAWLYFCSAYSGHDYHRRQWIRRTALGVYAVIVLIKLTNPIHGIYFRTTTTTQPFAHLVVNLDTIHWIVTGLSYALASIGFYLIYQTIDNSRADVRTLGVVVATAALPIVLYISSFSANSEIITLHYEPLGVAVFAFGVLFVLDDEFASTPRFWREKIIDDIGEVVVVTDNDGYIRDYNRRASEMLPRIAEKNGRLLAKSFPEIEQATAGKENIMTVCGQNNDTTYHYQVTNTSLSQVHREVGQAYVCTDVTSAEQQRRKLKEKNEQLEYKNEQLDDFATAITHELRNTLTIAGGYLEEISAEETEVNTTGSDEAIESIKEAHNRMGRIVTDLARLARSDYRIGETEKHSLTTVVKAAHNHIDPDALSVEVEEDVIFEVDRALFYEMYTVAVQFTQSYGGNRLKVDVGKGAITITTDSDPIPVDALDGVFRYGEAAPSAKTGMLFPTMETIARSHGWSVDIDPTYRDGVRIRICGIEMC